MLAHQLHTHAQTATTDAQTETIQPVSPTALRCACREFALNHFCAHLVYYTVAKVLAARERSPQRKEVNLSQHQITENRIGAAISRQEATTPISNHKPERSWHSYFSTTSPKHKGE